MKKMICLLFFLLITSNSLTQNLSKVYLLSEGGFNPGTSKLSMLDATTNIFTEDIFSPGQLGLYPDGIIFHEDHLYITEQGNFGGSGKIYKVDTTGMVINSALVGTNPYSLAIANNKIYITNGPASNVSVLNLGDFSFVKTIPVGVYPQEIISFNDKIFVANTSLYGGASDSTISVIDPSTDSVITSIVVKLDPSSFAVSNDNLLFIGCPGNVNDGEIFKVDAATYQVVDSYSFTNYGFSKDIVPDKMSDNVYFISYENHIVKYNLMSGDISIVVTSVYPANFYYGYNYDYLNKTHYILDAKDFVVSGELVIYDSTGTSVENFTAGIAPRRVLLKYNNMPNSVSEEYVISSYMLEQNYPNPFNPSTKVRFTISDFPAGSGTGRFTILKVYDVLGNEVKTLIEREMPAGVYEVEFDASGLNSGIYFYTLSAGNYVVTKKMILMK
ncbi:MAG: T9SS type A sorting domain-containing protein [Ignavibacteriaceae bacterium]